MPGAQQRQVDARRPRAAQVAGRQRRVVEVVADRQRAVERMAREVEAARHQRRDAGGLGGREPVGRVLDRQHLVGVALQAVEAAQVDLRIGLADRRVLAAHDGREALLPGRADLAWASSPCQDFSLAGGRAGLAGGRSSAFFGFWRLIEALAGEGRAPSLIVIENVSGLLTSHGGRDFAALGEALASQGYGFGALEVDAAAFLISSPAQLRVAEELYPDVKFHAMREHGGKVFSEKA